VGVLRQPLLIRLSEWLEGFLYRHANLVMVNSPGFIEHVRSRGARKIELVPNGAETSMFNPDDDGLQFRQTHGLEGKFVALYAGAHGMSNDLDVVLESAKILQPRKDILFILLGDGKEKPSLQARAADESLSNVCFLPPIPKLEMPAALAAADVCIAILKPIEMYKTTYPNKVFDYMAAGRPVVLAIDGVIRQVIEQAGGGIAVRPGDPIGLADAVRKLADDPKMGREMGRLGHNYVKAHFDRAVLADRLMILMQELVS
jgi:glycosyltransferase involved in cell wall biosynthesis